MSNTRLIEKQIEEINIHIKNYKSELTNGETVENNDDINIISLIGDRGFGKTTILNVLEHGNEMDLYIDIIKPMYVNGEDNNGCGVMEFIFANIYKEIKNNKKIKPALQRQLSTEIESSLNTLFNKGISKLDKLESSLFVLDKLNEQTMIRDKVEKLFKSVLKALEKELIIIRIDDLDLFSKENLKNSIEDLHKFFTIKNVVIIVAYNESQLIEKYTSQKVDDNSLLLEKELTSKSSIHNQVNNELKKTLLINSKVYLPSILEVYSMEAQNLFSTANENITIKEYLLKRHGCICPVNPTPYYSYESDELILPNSIREIKQTASLFDAFGESHNITKYRSWLLSNMIQKIENVQYQELIKGFDRVDKKSEYVVKHLRRLSKESTFGKRIEDYGIMEENSRDYSNIALGDLQQVLNTYNDFDNSQDAINLIYGLKLLFSLEMRELLLEYKESKNTEKINAYFSIAKGYPTPIDRTYFDSYWIPMFTKSEIEDPMIKEYEKIMLIANMVSPYNLGEKVYQNSSFIINSLNSLVTNQWNTSSTRKESKLNLFDTPNGGNKEIVMTPIGYFEARTNINQLVLPSYSYLSNPYCFFLTKPYIDWALKSDQLVLWDMFTLDYLYDLKTHRSSETDPWLRVCRRIDSQITHQYELRDDRYHNVYDVEKNIIKNSKTISWWEELVGKFGIDFDDDKEKLSIVNRGYEDLKKKLALYTRYEDKFVLSNIKDFGNIEVSQYYELIKDWTEPKEKLPAGKNPDSIITLANKKEIWENLEFRKRFKEQFGYNITKYELEKEYYSGTEVKSMRSFITAFKVKDNA